jgi:hypothetical protein
LAIAFALLPVTQAEAITAKQKMATCVFGADNPGGGRPKLVGKERARFLKNCMSPKNDPRGAAPGMPAAPGVPPRS